MVAAGAPHYVAEDKETETANHCLASLLHNKPLFLNRKKGAVNRDSLLTKFNSLSRVTSMQLGNL